MYANARAYIRKYVSKGALPWGQGYVGAATHIRKCEDEGALSLGRI